MSVFPRLAGSGHWALWHFVWKAGPRIQMLFGNSIALFFNGGEAGKAENHAVEFVKASGNTPEDFHSLKEVFKQISGLVVAFVQGPWLLAIYPGITACTSPSPC